MTTKRSGTTTQLWRCPSCGYDHIPDDDYSEFFCFGCGPMDGANNKCKEIHQCDDCGEDQDACTCCKNCNDLECEGCIPSMICRECKARLRVRSRCQETGKPMTALCPTIGCKGQKILFPVAYGGDGFAQPTEVPLSGI